MKTNLLVCIFCLIVFGGYSQKTGIDAANKKHAQYAYIDAIKMYERIAAKGYKSADMFQKLGDAYYLNAQHREAAKWYGELFAMKKEVKPLYYYRYAQSLKSLQQYEKSDELMLEFAAKSKSDSRAALFNAKRDYHAEIKANSGRYVLSDAGINSEYSDYGSAVFGSKLVFASARDTGGLMNRRHKWTNQSFTNLYSASISGDTLSNVEKFASGIRSRFHESTPVFTKDGTTMYFTRNNFNNGKKGKNSKKITLLKIYRAHNSDGKWSDAKELPFNSDNYSAAHPTLSMDERYLYFSSDMPGTIGQSDLYRAAINQDGTFGKPENLGTGINTEGRETFPAISAANELYFASDGRPGLGGLDIYMSVITADNSLTEPKNIGEPANSPNDDFGYMIDSKTKTGFLTSNRAGGKGYDDIYKFREITPLICEHILEGTVTDLHTGEIIAGAMVTIYNDDGKKIADVVSDEEGHYSTKIPCGATFHVHCIKPLYPEVEQTVMIPQQTGTTNLPLQLAKSVIEVKVGTDLAKVLEIKIIYFDLDKWDIREDAAFELEKILDVLEQYPAMKIDVRAHTDSRQTDKYNAALSEKRAQSTVDWLVSNGIGRSRLSGKGYGETRLLNKCSDGVKCTEEEHQQNRRSEFIVTEL